ncbi:hypothetical protein N473_09095 [Pseudoalteromonas luteoviolacea CPMOR-1]|uniref:Beta/gamma crystallin 'Greek key' domain-containing protein n=1 Tax=Pseudoalteromonas luteoviolacea CPMOR-1 TaxID=1365248 RepID=A0A161YV69_9GAMM|nr:beta/gamma crystallin-related protein [Pseudoalteromonas luteoviolacea]KZN66538.1 hypothetical protein N473_09095 [Pseudoalteromonas luteoviolacea CPMOR-1]
MNKFTVACLAILTSAASHASVTVYEHHHFRGKSTVIHDGEMVDAIGKREVFANDSISSLKVDYGTCAVLYKDAGYSSTAKYFSGGEYVDLDNQGFNDETSSIQVFRSNRCDSSVMTHFYAHRDYRKGGGDFSLPPNTYLRDLEGGYWHTRDGGRKVYHANDKITSIKVGINSCVIAYQDHHFRGTKKEFSSNVATLASHRFNDAMSSVRVVAGRCSRPSTGVGSGNVGGGGGGGGEVPHSMH